MPAALQLGVPPRRFLLFRPRPDHSQHIRLPHQNPFGLFSVGEAPDSRFLPAVHGDSVSKFATNPKVGVQARSLWPAFLRRCSVRLAY